MADVFISNDSIADVQVKSQRQLYLFGKAGGVVMIALAAYMILPKDLLA